MTDPTILLIEDEPDTLVIMELVLASSGYDPIIAKTVEAGLEILLSTKIDILITDYNLGNKNASDVISGAGSNLPAKVILVTGKAFASPNDEVPGITHYLQKPLSIHALIKAIED